MSKFIKVDEENNAEQWWEEARRIEWHGVPKECLDLSKPGVMGVRVAKPIAKAFIDWASKLPGWSDGPKYAPHPFIVQDA